MPLLAYGVSFRSAAIELRERLAFPQETLTEALADLCEGVVPVAEAAILSTCNRTEIYCALDEADQEPVAQWLAANRAVDADELTGAAYALWDRDAAHHLMRVAAGLDSQVLGEPQIMGQVKAAYDLARASGTLGPELNLLAQTTFNVAKRVRTETDIGKHPVSVAYAAVRMAQTLFADLGSAHALLVGAGETIELAARHLRKAGVGAMSIANRTLERAERLGRAVGAEAMTLRPDRPAPRRVRHRDQLHQRGRAHHFQVRRAAGSAAAAAAHVLGGFGGAPRHRPGRHRRCQRVSPFHRRSHGNRHGKRRGAARAGRTRRGPH